MCLQLPDVQRMARNISRLIETGVESEVKRGRNALERVSSDVQKAVGSTLPQLKQHLRSAGTIHSFSHTCIKKRAEMKKKEKETTRRRIKRKKALER